MTSLANQLAALRQENGSIITDKKKRKAQHSVSLIYEPSVAASQSYDTLLEIGLEGLRDLQLLDPRFGIFENSIFSETAIDVDRNVQTVEQNQLLDNAINNFLSLLAPRINIQPAVKALEWLVRRFMIHQFNGEQLLLTVLPYYSNPIFLRILDILPSNLPPIFSFLSNSKRHIQNPSRNLLIRALSTDSQFLDLLNSHVTQIITEHREYHDLLAFWSSFSIWTMISLKEQRVADEDIVNKFLEPVSKALSSRKSSDVQIAGYMVLTVLATQFHLSKEVRQAAITSIALNWSKTSQKSGFSCITQLIESYDENDAESLLSKDVFSALKKAKNLVDELIRLSSHHSVGKFTIVWIKHLFSDNDIQTVDKILENSKFSDVVFIGFIDNCIEYGLNGQTNQETKEQIGNLLQKYSSRESFDEVLSERLRIFSSNIDNLELSLQISLKLTNEIDMIDEEQEENVVKSIENDTNFKDKVDNLKPSKIISYLSRDDETNEDLKIRSSIFSHLKGETGIEQLKIPSQVQLSFFARLWISKSATFSRIKALKLFNRHLESNTDYQAFIPCLLYALTDDSERIRREAGNVFIRLANLSKPSKVWGLDVVYGSDRSTEVKWLGEKDEKKLLTNVIIPHLSECYLDPTYIIGLFATLKNSKDLKTIAGNLSSFLSSHALAVELPAVKNLLLKCILSLDSKTNSKNLAFLFGSWLENHSKWQQWCEEDGISIEELDKTVVNCVTNGDKTALKFLQDCISGKNSSLAALACRQIEVIWKDLKSDAQLFLLQFLTDAITNDNMELDTMSTLQNLDINANQFVELLESCKLERDRAVTPGNTVAKRRRRSSASSRQQLQSGELANFAEKHLKKLTCILELLDSQTKRTIGDQSRQLDSNSKLLSQLFIILGEVVSLGLDAKLPVLYTEQVLADCMISVVNKLKEHNWRSSKIDSNLVRVGTIVSCIRSCPSPQVQNRLLLLVANLAELAPEVVLHSVMPIFTFMGANTLRFDDEFSAHVIQRTIEQIIPALLSQGNDKEEVDFLLLSFSAAFVHIPRHRRFKLFRSLVDSLGISESLYKLMLLLAEKYCDATMKRKTKEANTSIQFGMAFLRSFTVEEQMIAIERYLMEVSVLFSEENSGSKAQPARSQTPLARTQLQLALLNSSKDEENTDNQRYFYEFLETVIGDQSIPGTTPLRLNFLTLNDENKNSVISHSTKILDLLIAKSNINSDEDEDTKMDIDGHGVDANGSVSELTVNEAAFKLLCTVLKVLPIDNFASVVTEILSSSSEGLLVKELAELISTKFNYELSDDDNAIQSAWKIMNTVSEGITQHPTLAADLFDCLDVLVSKYGSKQTDNSKLLNMLDVAAGSLGLQNDDWLCFVSSVACCNSICNVLGALSISKFPMIIPVVIDRFKSSLDLDDESREEKYGIQLSVFALFGGLIKRVPTFMISTVPKIFELIFISDSSLTHRQRLIGIILDSIPKDEIIKSLSKSWRYCQETGLESMVLFLNSLDEVLDIMSKKEVTQNSSILISIILDVFEVREWAATEQSNGSATGEKSQSDAEKARQMHLGTGEINHIESKAVSSALKIVMRLNDKTFRPLFIDMVQWTNENENQDRLIVFFKFFVKLLTNLKSIVTNYFGYVLDIVTNVLVKMSESPEKVADSLKRSVLNSCIASFQYDGEEFWQSQARFDKISTVLTDLIPSIDNNLGKLLVKSLVTLAESIGSTEMYRQLNDGVCTHLHSSCKVNEKIWAIRTIKGFYSKLGEEWVTMLPQLVPLTAELLEDDDESVEMEVRRNLVPVMEEVLGESLDRYLS